ncbi:DUF2971 domain-containing protein [Rhodococcus sp. KRD197]|uniref:DUF2971 domain-containing protein n=1 Tax=Rhodococcus sp. KRD197 TaxID=2729731 RepID=UPI0019D28D25|nr:DUF2971 domain-containing protein [Rhodococcus sp. KRD197]
MNESQPAVNNIPVPPLPEAPIWHYTDTAGLLGILRNVDKTAEKGSRVGTYKPVLHATAAQFLNDRRELTLGLGLVKEALDEFGGPGRQWFDDNPGAKNFLGQVAAAIQQIIDRTYPRYIHCSTISFSTVTDSLSQWRAYGRGTGGFAIEFNPSKFPRNSTSERRSGLGWQKITYVTDTLEGTLLDAFHHFVGQAMTDIRGPNPTPLAVNKAVQRLAFHAASFKHMGFAEENEWRFVEPGFGHAPGESNDPEFKFGAAGLTPYRAVELPADAVMSLWVGPGPYQYENYLAAQSMLHRYGYVAASRNVHCSSTPFR